MITPSLKYLRAPHRFLAAAGWSLLALVASAGLTDWITDGFGVRWQGPEVIAVYVLGLFALVLAGVGVMRCGVARYGLLPAVGAHRPLGLPRRDWVFSIVFAVVAAPGLWAIRNWASAEFLAAACGH